MNRNERITSDIFPQRTSGLGQPNRSMMSWKQIDNKIDKLKMMLSDLQRSNTKSTNVGRDRDVGGTNLV